MTALHQIHALLDPHLHKPAQTTSPGLFPAHSAATGLQVPGSTVVSHTVPPSHVPFVIHVFSGPQINFEFFSPVAHARLPFSGQEPPTIIPLAPPVPLLLVALVLVAPPVPLLLVVVPPPAPPPPTGCKCGSRPKSAVHPPTVTIAAAAHPPRPPCEELFMMPWFSSAVAASIELFLRRPREDCSSAPASGHNRVRRAAEHAPGVSQASCRDHGVCRLVGSRNQHDRGPEPCRAQGEADRAKQTQLRHAACRVDASCMSRSLPEAGITRACAGRPSTSRGVL
jgi:hypothetical protein